MFTLPGNIKLTDNLMNAIRDGYRGLRGIPNPVASIEFSTPIDQGKAGYWVISFFSRQYAPDEAVYKIDDLHLALSETAKDKLRGKLVDVVDGHVVVSD